MASPSQELLEVISPLLVKEKLLLAVDAEKYKGKIAAGTMKAEDWLLAVEKALEKEAKQ
ncbi:hypothetical protein [Nitrosomonas sp.]|uniref:hypothetical protein n=1 Tax=Nitrosomonas sp. TaxID=42353 RepID=UPI0033056237